VFLAAVHMKAVWTSACVVPTGEYVDGAARRVKSVADMNSVQCVYDDMLQSVIKTKIIPLYPNNEL
jgi:hypothetical protein